MLPFLKSGKKIIGIDLLPNYHEGYEHIKADYELLPFGENQFDAILCSHTLEHMLNPGHVLMKMKHELTIGGWLGLNLPGGAQDKFHPGHLTLWTPMHITGYLMAAGWDCADAYWYTSEDRDTIGYVVQNKDTPVHDSAFAVGEYFPKNLTIEKNMSAWQPDRWF